MQQIITEVGKDVGDFIKDFTIHYIRELVNSKLQDAMNNAVDKVMPSAFKDQGYHDDDDGVDEKSADQKSDDPPIAAGVALIGHRMGYGPDRAYHRYYDFAVWCVKPTDSVIAKVVRRHKPILDWSSSLKKVIADAPVVEFPTKKFFGKNPEYYRNRFITMRTYFKTMSPVQIVSISDYFLTEWNLKYDKNREASRVIFFAALQSTCEDGQVNWNEARWRAQTLGLDMDEVEMLKVVAVEKVGEAATQKIRDQVYALGYVPGPVKGKFISSAEAKLAGIISATVENGWRAAQDTFNKIADELNAALDKAMDPLQQLIDKILDPVGKLVKEKFDKLDNKLDADDGLDREIKATRFPPLAAALQAFEGGKAMDIIPNLIKSIDQMFEAHRYVGYLRYNLGDPEIGQYVPYLDQIQDNHYRLTIALTDIAYVTSRAGVNAFEPLLKYVDKVAENGYDEKTHQKEIQDHVREGGRRLAIDFFSLPETIDRACWYCGSTTTATVTKVAETTTWGLADLLGSVAVNWKPTSKEDAKPKFIEAFKEPLNAFISDRVKTFVTAVRKSTANIIAQQLFSVIGNGIDSITNTINDLCKALPNPIGDNLKAGDMVKYLLIKMANNCVTIGVKMLAKKTETTMYSDDGVAEVIDEWEVNRLRWRPRIRNYDEDSAEEEADPNAKKADANANKTETTDANKSDNANANTATTTDTTTDTTTTTN